MKFFASIWIPLLTLPILLAIQIVTWLIWGNSFAIFLTLLLVQVSLIIMFIWLAVRQHRTIVKLERSSSRNHEKLGKQNQRTHEIITSSKASFAQLSKTIEFNTRELRRFAQKTNIVEAHPRELQAIDNIGVIRDQVEQLRTEVETLNMFHHKIAHHRDGQNS